MGEENSPWVTKASREVYRNNWIRVREDQVIRPDGGPGVYGVIEIKPSVGVVALDAHDRTVLVGLAARIWQNLGAVDVCNGVANDVQTLFLATDLSETSRNLDPEEEIAVRWVPFSEAVRMALDGGITEVCSVAAILRVALFRAGATK